MNELTEAIAVDLALKSDEVQKYAMGRKPKLSKYRRDGSNGQLTLNFDSKEDQTDSGTNNDEDDLDVDSNDETSANKKSK